MLMARRRGPFSDRCPPRSAAAESEALVANVAREFGVVGLGRMGGGLALQALEKGMRVVGFDSRGAPADMVKAGLIGIRKLNEFRQNLSAPRAILVYVPAGPAVDQVLADVAAQLSAGDVLVDGGNSYWGDSIRRHRHFKEKGINLVDLGTSG